MLELASAFVEGAKDDFVEMIYTVIINSFKVFLSIRHFPFVLTVFSITLLTIDSICEITSILSQC